MDSPPDPPPPPGLVHELAAAALDVSAPEGSVDRFVELCAASAGAVAGRVVVRNDRGTAEVLGATRPAPFGPGDRGVPMTWPLRLAGGARGPGSATAPGDGDGPEGYLELVFDVEASPHPAWQSTFALAADLLGRALGYRRAHTATVREAQRLREAQEQLVHAGKMAAIGTLVAGLSHELNNPLGIIVGYAQGLLRRMPEGAPGRESLVAIERQALRSAHLVRSLLDFSRNGPARREETFLPLLVERTLELAAGQAHRRMVTLHWESRGPLPPVTVCAQEIESALLNLVSNALDATPPRGTVTLSAAPADRDGKSGVDLTITDTGAGIPEAVLPRIFDPFFTTKPVGQGTGIGLALTRQAVEGHGGRIEVETAEGRGTTMRLWLPTGGAGAVDRGADEVPLGRVAAGVRS
jgi:signal transduction histidine kinase